MPFAVFPEITLRSAAVEPPTVLFVASARSSTPLPALATAAVPAAFSPIQLPAIRLFELW